MTDALWSPQRHTRAKVLATGCPCEQCKLLLAALEEITRLTHCASDQLAICSHAREAAEAEVVRLTDDRDYRDNLLALDWRKISEEYRELSLRFSEDRDVQKHCARALQGRCAALEASLFAASDVIAKATEAQVVAEARCATLEAEIKMGSSQAGAVRVAPESPVAGAPPAPFGQAGTPQEPTP